MRDVFCSSHPFQLIIGRQSDQLYSPVSPVSAVHSKLQDKVLDRTWLTMNYPLLFSTHTREVFSWVSVTSQWGQLLISPKKCTLCGYQAFKMYLWPFPLSSLRCIQRCSQPILCLLFSIRCSLFLIWLCHYLDTEHVSPAEKLGLKQWKVHHCARCLSRTSTHRATHPPLSVWVWVCVFTYR